MKIMDGIKPGEGAAISWIGSAITWVVAPLSDVIPVISGLGTIVLTTLLIIKVTKELKQQK